MIAIQDIMETVPGIKQVGGAKTMPLDIQNFPAGFVVQGGDDVFQYIGDFEDINLEVDLIGVVRSQTNVLQALAKFRADVKKTMAADHTLGGLAIDFKYQNSDPPQLYEGEPQAAQRLGYLCTYRVRSNDPYS